jgi:hypothetical protein
MITNFKIIWLIRWTLITIGSSRLLVANRTNMMFSRNIPRLYC